MAARLLSAALAALLVLGGCAGTVPLRTPSPSQDVVVARFLLDVDGLDADFPAPGGGLIPTGSRVLQTGRDVADAVEILRHPEGSVVKAAQDSVFAAFAAGLDAHARLRVLPLETLRGTVPYLVGAPMGQARDVAHGRTALEVDVFVEVPDAGQGSWSILGTGRARVTGHPEMTVVVRMLGPDGRVTWQDRTRVRARERVQLDERWVLGIRTDRTASDASSLPALMTRAVEKLLRRAPAA